MVCSLAEVSAIGAFRVVPAPLAEKKFEINNLTLRVFLLSVQHDGSKQCNPSHKELK